MSADVGEHAALLPGHPANASPVADRLPRLSQPPRPLRRSPSSPAPTPPSQLCARTQRLALASAFLLWACDGAEIVLLSFLSACLACSPWHTSPMARAALSSAVLAAALGGVVGLGALADCLGRAWVSRLSAAGLVASAGLSALAPSFPALLAARALAGAALGGAPVVLALCSEWGSARGEDERGGRVDGASRSALRRDTREVNASPSLSPPSKCRYSAGIFVQLGWPAGTAGGALVACLALLAIPSLGWRLMLLLGGIGPACALGLLLVVPESPAWAQREHGPEQRCPSPEQNTSRPAAETPSHPAAGMEEGAPAKTPFPPRRGSFSNEKQPPCCLWSTPWLARLRLLYGEGAWKISLLLYVAWFAAALIYYGTVFLLASLRHGGETPEAPECHPDGRPVYELKDFVMAGISGLGEVAGILGALQALRQSGCRATLVICYAVVAAALAMLCLVPGRLPQQALLACARASVQGAFGVLYIYTPEHYPSKIRGLGTALCIACARVGSMLAPFVTVSLADGGVWRAKVALCALGSAALVATYVLPLDTPERRSEQECQLLRAHGDVCARYAQNKEPCRRVQSAEC